MNHSQLRLEQYETVLFNANQNPLGVPESVTKVLEENLDAIGRYPVGYYGKLKESIGEYVSCNPENIILGSGFSDLLRLFTALITPKKALVPIPSSDDYEKVLSIFGCDTTFYELEEANDYVLDVKDLISTLDDSYDMVILGNPNNPTSQIISREDMETLAAACKQLGIFLVIDEMYIEFTEKYDELTAVPLTDEYDNIAVLRGVTKFFAVPGLRLAYAIMNNLEYMSIINITNTPDNISTLTAIACTELFKDFSYVTRSRSQIFTERNLIYSAMVTNKNLKLYKPYANFMLAKLLKEDVSASSVAANCNLKGIIIKNCTDIRGLDDRYIRFCFMNPRQNDLLVNTILEQL